MNLNGWVVLLYGVIVLVGGMIGYIKTDSSASIIMGTIFGVILCGSSLMTVIGMKSGHYIASAGTGLLLLFFGYRFILTAKFMPAGLMCLISAAVLYMLLKKRYMKCK